MENALELRGIKKHYPSFSMEGLDLTLPKGCIMGFVGENGAGKSTTIKLILNLIRRDAGEIAVFGKDNLKFEKEIKEETGVVFDDLCLAEVLTPRQYGNILKSIYRHWDEKQYLGYLARFGLPLNQTVKEFSRGMRMKLALCAALSHHAKLLILDEPTSGLDPVVRDEILDVFLDFIQDEEHSIFFSSHITTDLEKIADYIAFLHKGCLVFCSTKDELSSRYGLLKCPLSEFDSLDMAPVVGFRKNQFGVEALVERGKLSGRHMVEPASIEDIMLYHIKGDSGRV